MFSSVFTTSSIDLLNGINTILCEQNKKAGFFPPYNIIKVDDNHYRLEFALAGFDIADIEVQVEKNLLRVSSKGHETTEEFLHRGFTYKGFSRLFDIVENVVVESAEMANGILSVFLELVTPEQEKPKTINIKSPTASAHPQLLNEESVI